MAKRSHCNEDIQSVRDESATPVQNGDDLPQIGLELRGAHNRRAVMTMDDAEFTDTFESYLHKQGTDVKLDYVGLKNDLKDQLQYFGE